MKRNTTSSWTWAANSRHPAVEPTCHEAAQYIEQMQDTIQQIENEASSIPDFCPVSRVLSDKGFRSNLHHVGVHLKHGIIVEGITLDPFAANIVGASRASAPSSVASLGSVSSSFALQHTLLSLSSISGGSSATSSFAFYTTFLQQLLLSSSVAGSFAMSRSVFSATSRDTPWKILTHTARILDKTKAWGPQLSQKAQDCFTRMQQIALSAASSNMRVFTKVEGIAHRLLLHAGNLPTILALESTRSLRLPPSQSQGRKNGVVRLTHMYDFRRPNEGGQPLDARPLQPAPASEHTRILARARKLLGPFDYSLAYCNCQHVAAYILGCTTEALNQAGRVGTSVGALTGGVALSTVAAVTGAASVVVPEAVLGSTVLGSLLGVTTTVLSGPLLLTSLAAGALVGCSVSAVVGKQKEEELGKQFTEGREPVYSSDTERMLMDKLEADHLAGSWDRT